MRENACLVTRGLSIAHRRSYTVAASVTTAAAVPGACAFPLYIALPPTAN